MQIDESDEQCQNADSSMNESLEPDSNVTVKMDSDSQKQCLPRLSTDEGMQIDDSEEHQQNADSLMEESLEPDSNVTVERDSHFRKQFLQSLSTDEGMQIDESDEQSQNTPSSTTRSREPLSKITFEIVPHSRKHPTSNCSINFGIVTSRLLPKYNFIRTPSKSRRNAPKTLKCRFPSEIEISCRLRPSNALGPSSRRPGGMQIDESDGQFQNADSSMDESLEPNSNVTVERDLHPEKHF
jgi:hypothetical protein